MASSAPEGPGLAREAIGLREVLFQSVTHMAPAAAVAFSIPAGASYAAGALPLATVLALIACLFVALSIGQLAKHLPSAGSFYTYASKGIHPLDRLPRAWAYAFAEAFIASFLFLVFAITVSGTLNTEFGWSTDTWWIWVVLSVAARLRPRLRGHPDLHRGGHDHGRVRDHHLRRACGVAHHRGWHRATRCPSSPRSTRPRKDTPASPG